MKFYLVGIKGTGMSALARILSDLGHQIKGTDYDEAFFTVDSKLDRIWEPFSKFKLDDSYFYIIGNAFINHPLSKKIIHSQCKYMFYPEFLDSFFNGTKIAVAGTHGKTTTTKFISQLIDSTYLIGDGEGKGNKYSKYFLFEACEYRNTFLNYHPQIAIITNIDFDHPDFYKDIKAYKESFFKFAEQVNLLIYNGDDSLLKELNHRNSISFGLNENNDYSCRYEVVEKGYKLYITHEAQIDEIFFPHFGLHNIYNFLAAYVLTVTLNIDKKNIKQITRNLLLPKRRFEEIMIGSNCIICDYAHHPTEIKSFYDALRLKYPQKKKILIFEPHTFSRTKAFYNQFKESFSLFDKVYLCDIFSSIREKQSDEKYFQEYLHYSLKIFKNQKINDACFCFLGAGINDKNYQELANYLKIRE